MNITLKVSKEKKKKINTVKEIKIVKNNIEKEIREICNTLQDLIDKFIMPNNDDIETLVFFYKLKADYFRYICEFAEEKEYNDNFSKAEEYYTKDYKDYKDDNKINENEDKSMEKEENKSFNNYNGNNKKKRRRKKIRKRKK